MGFCIVMALILFKLGLTICNIPGVFGVNWAYVFPLAGLASSVVKYAEFKDTPQARILAWVFVGLS